MTTARPMTLSEKILCHNAIGLTAPEVSPGDMICVKVSWTLASELTWNTMDRAYTAMGRPKIWRPDRFWLAIDHTVDPRINDQPKPKRLIKLCKEFAQEAGLTDFHGPNETILHTEFYRQRAQPGMVVCGADSHSCSAGGMGAWAIGLGAADVVMPMVTGETWIRVPETLKIEFVGEPAFGIGGKDLVLYMMGKLKRNTVAFERAVEYTGNLKHLSVDARFAISNMTAEFGGMVGIFEGDELTAQALAKRPNHNEDGVYFRADPDAKYAEVHTIDMSTVEPQVALFPSPDNCVPVTEVVGKKLDGVFIGACTTAEEDLVLAALVLEVMMGEGFKVADRGRRLVTPGSTIITEKLKANGLQDVYENAGFRVGSPGCSMCIGVAADVAGEGEVWLSSQNRNFKNRMGKGSFANLASAATVAASSFGLEIIDPRPYLAKVDRDRFYRILGRRPDDELSAVPISQPAPKLVDKSAAIDLSGIPALDQVIKGNAQVFGDHVDTDAIIPAQHMHLTTEKELGDHCFLHVRPEFRERCRAGQTIVVGGIGFGSGSSREEAVTALKGIGVQAVIAKSFAFIFGRNLSNMNLLGIIIKDDAFYALAEEGAPITIDIPKSQLTVKDKVFKFGVSLIEERLLAGGGVVNMYNQYKNNLFRVAVTPKDW